VGSASVGSALSVGFCRIRRTPDLFRMEKDSRNQLRQSCRLQQKPQLVEKRMPVWEYEKIDLNDLPRKRDDTDLLNDAGKDGWELVSISSNNFAYMKRMVPTPGGKPRGKVAKE
jgi:hypothetical protein